jgi:hypothetical protein
MSSGSATTGAGSAQSVRSAPPAPPRGRPGAAPARARGARRPPAGGRGCRRLLEPCEVEQLAHELPQPLASSWSRPIIDRARSGSRSNASERVRERLDARHRGLQLVGGVRDEVASHLLDATGIGEVGDDERDLTLRGDRGPCHERALVALHLHLDGLARLPGLRHRVGEPLGAEDLQRRAILPPADAEQLARGGVRVGEALLGEQQHRGRQGVEQPLDACPLVGELGEPGAQRDTHGVQRAQQSSPLAASGRLEGLSSSSSANRATRSATAPMRCSETAARPKASSRPTTPRGPR